MAYVVYATVNDSYVRDITAFDTASEANDYCNRHGWEIQDDDGIWYDLGIECLPDMY